VSAPARSAETGGDSGVTRRTLGIAAFEYKLPLVEKLSRVVLLGAGSCELATPGDVTADSAAEVAETLAATGVRATAVASLSKPNAPDGEETGLRLLEESIRSAHALRAPFAVAYFGGHPTRGAAEAIERYRELTRPMVELAEELDVTILVENHFSHAPGDVTSGPTGCAELIAAVDSRRFALNFDPCNFAIAGVDVAAAYQELKEAVRNVHVKDARPYDEVADSRYPGRIVEDLHRGKFIFVPVGEGIADNASVLTALLRDGYEGPVTVEAHTPEETLDDVFARGLAYCRETGL
jgi:sugar phosphate isomerase/epimerase